MESPRKPKNKRVCVCESFWLLIIFSDLLNKKTSKITSVKTINMSTKWNEDFKPGFIQHSDFCLGNVCKLENI